MVGMIVRVRNQSGSFLGVKQRWTRVRHACCGQVPAGGRTLCEVSGEFVM